MKQAVLDKYGPPEDGVRCADVPDVGAPGARLLCPGDIDRKPGDWVIQNVANSAVGRLVITLAKARGIKTMNVVRRESLFPELAALGADACVVDGPELAEMVRQKSGGGA